MTDGGAGERCTTVSAPGKVLIAGGYLVLDRPNVGVVLAATARFFSSIKWTEEKVPVTIEPAVQEATHPIQVSVRIKVESPQFRSVHWYVCVAHEAGSLPILLTSPDQTSNVFVERALTYVLGYMLQAELGSGKPNSLKEGLRLAWAKGRLLAIKLRADNDFYSQTSQLHSRGLPCTSSALASLPPFLECPVSEDGAVIVAKTGMGSSAALVSSLVGALLSFFGAASLPCFDDVLDQTQAATPGSESQPHLTTLGVKESLGLTHNLAQACHCVAQGKVGSGFDISAAIYGTHTYVRFSPTELADALSAGDAPPSTSCTSNGSVGHSSTDRTPLERLAMCVQAPGGWDAERGQLRIPSCFRLLMGDVCGGSSTPSMVRKIQAWRANPSTADRAKEVWSSLGSTNAIIAKMLNSLATSAAVSGYSTGEKSFEAGAQALSSLPSSKWAELAKRGMHCAADTLEQLLQLREAFAKARQLLREMGEDAGVPIEPPVQTKLLDATSALPGILCAGVPGAGGVDAVFAIVVHPDAEDGVRDLWANWLVERVDVKSEDGRGVVCPLLLTASAGGSRGGILSTTKMAWQ